MRTGWTERIMIRDSELLISLSEAELKALADGRLATASQARIDELLELKANAELSPEDTAELDRLLGQVDQLTVLKTRARYTLRQQAEATES
jgi:hypothetical protein